MFLSLICITLHAFIARAAFDISFESDDDLTNFVSRPDIKAPLLKTTIYDEAATLPGKWFITPYADIKQQSHARNYYQACQTGPAIYDAYGELIWSGACDVLNQNSVDFRVIVLNGSDHLSMILHAAYGLSDKGHGVILNSSFDVVHEIRSKIAVPNFNMHELKILPTETGLTALHFGTRPAYMDLRDLGLGEDYEEGFVLDSGIREVDVITGKTVFEWWPSDWISPAESYSKHEKKFTHINGAWNWMFVHTQDFLEPLLMLISHGNSIDKSDDGDYLLSARFTSTIYRISGKDGSIQWRLGGNRSTFKLDGFNFTAQHDARWISSNEKEEIISFLDNGAENLYGTQTTNTSSCLIVSLDKTTTPPVARVLNRWWRPDGKVSYLRGNFQTFTHSKNVVASWSDNAYISEHDEFGRLLTETRFQSERMVTYRAYKYNFTGTPTEPPDLAVFSFGASEETTVTVAYVSWNGATEVARWDLFSADDTPVLLGSTPKTGFETLLQVAGYYPTVFAEAYDKDGHSLGRSEVRNMSSMTRSRAHTEDDANLSEPSDSLIVEPFLGASNAAAPSNSSQVDGSVVTEQHADDSHGANVAVFVAQDFSKTEL